MYGAAGSSVRFYHPERKGELGAVHTNTSRLSIFLVFQTGLGPASVLVTVPAYISYGPLVADGVFP